MDNEEICLSVTIKRCGDDYFFVSKDSTSFKRVAEILQPLFPELSDTELLKNLVLYFVIAHKDISDTLPDNLVVLLDEVIEFGKTLAHRLNTWEVPDVDYLVMKTFLKNASE